MYDDLPENLVHILAVIDELEVKSEIQYGSRTENLSNGKRIVEKLFPKQGTTSHVLHTDINIIPSDGSGDCTETLLVAIGRNDDCEKRLLEAIEHIFVTCVGTKYVVFYAAEWDSVSWLRHSRGFKKRGLYAMLKNVGQKTIRLQ